MSLFTAGLLVVVVALTPTCAAWLFTKLYDAWCANGATKGEPKP